MDGGSLEVRQVYSSFAKLCRVVQTSNTAFFVGNIVVARNILIGALELFRKMNNRKAVGVASNNLANTYYALIHYSRINQIPIDRDTEAEDIAFAVALYDESVEIARRDFYEETDLVEKALYSEQYSDRRFNRGLFLLLVCCDDGCPDDAKERGLADVARSRQLDYDARGFWISRDLVSERSSELFARMVRRIHGLVTNYDDDDLRLVWNAKELIDDASDLLFTSDRESASVFRHLNLTGRLQQLESAVIRLEMWLRNFPEAARIGMRMLTEDEYILEDSFQKGAASILKFIQESQQSVLSPVSVSSFKSDVRKMLHVCKQKSISTGKCVLFAFELSKKWDLDPILDTLNKNVLRLFDEGCDNDDWMGLVAFCDGGDDLMFGLGPKSENAGLHRSSLDMATLATSSCTTSALPISLQMIVDSHETLDNDTFVVLVTDGRSWNDAEARQILERIENLNEERSTSVHMLVLCLEVSDNSVLSTCKEFGMITPESHAFSVDSGNIDSVFSDLARILASDNRIVGDLHGITMEQF